MVLQTQQQQQQKFPDAPKIIQERADSGSSGGTRRSYNFSSNSGGDDNQYGPQDCGNSISFDLAENAYIPYSTVQCSGPASQPLKFPEPMANRAITVSADVIDHSTQTVFRASSVMMRRPNHCKDCAALTPPSSASNSPTSSSSSSTFTTVTSKTNSRDAAHSWHSAFNAPPVPTAGVSSAKKQPIHHHHHHRRTHSNPPLNNVPCGMECDLPDVAYCVRRKLKETAYGSIKLCVVLRRVNRNIMANVKSIDQSGFEAMTHQHPHGGRTTLQRNFRVEELDKHAMPEDPTWETTDEMVAVKVVNLAKYSALQGMMNMGNPINELAALQLLGAYHPNIISLTDALQNDSHLFIVTPYIPGSDLPSRIISDMENSQFGRVDETQVKLWFKQILSAISHLQKKGVCHRDLCMDNIIVDEYGNLRIVDFGLCLRVAFADPINRHLVTDVSAGTSRRLMKGQGQAGNWAYMSPEVALKAEVFDGFAVDLWSAGILLFEIIVGKKPFGVPNPDDPNFRQISIDGDLVGFLHAKSIQLNTSVVDLLQKMLMANPQQRYTLSEIIDHPWMQGNHGGERPQPSAADRMSMWFVQNNAIDDADDVHLSQFNRLRADTTSTIFSLEKDLADEATVESSEDRGSPYSDMLNEDNEEEDRQTKSKSVPSRLKSKSWWRGVMKSIYKSISLLYRQNSKKCEISTSDDSNEEHMTGNLC